jgi:hypothetical protein
MKSVNTGRNKFSNTVWSKILLSTVIPALIAFIATLITFYYLQVPHDIKIVEITQQYAFQNALAQKRLELSEQIIAYRQTGMDLISRIKNGKKYQVEQAIEELNLKITKTNSVSLIHGMQPYNAIMNFDVDRIYR